MSPLGCRSLLTHVLLLWLIASACSVIGDDDPPWDTNVPDSAPVEAKLATWSPDGSRIAFVHTPPWSGVPPAGHFEQLWTVHLDSGERRHVLTGPALTPDWHPDGSRLVFHSGRFPQYLFTIGVDGTSLRQLTGPNSPNPDLEYSVVGRWSPSGDRLLFAVEAGERSGIYTMSPNGADVQKLMDWSVMPDWFPDGERIAYISWGSRAVDDSRRKQIYVAHADGTNRRKLTDLDTTWDLAAPTVSPSGKQIAFAYQDQIYLMNADGTDIRRVTGGDGYAGAPEWNPDGNTILFTRLNFLPGSRAINRLFFLDVETLEVTPVFPAGEEE